LLECNIQRKLNEFDMTQWELSHRAGTTPQSLYAWMNGKNVPSLEAAFKIAAVFKCSIEDIWSYKEEKKHQTSK
jgi:putative transcriptional regulator